MNTDTIAAIATAMVPSGIGIIRISGEDAFTIADKIFQPIKSKHKVSEMETHTIHYGYIKNGNEIIDEVLLLLMRGPNSYTKEDTIEIDTHGGILVMQKILKTVLSNGARPAEPGEFTKRAFLNGRIDLSQAESVIEIINAQNDYALKSSVRQLTGSVLEKIRSIRERILHQIAFIESALDDPEHYTLDGYEDSLLKIISSIHSEIQSLIDKSDDGRVIKEGIKTAIVGKPNAGKSSLLNNLLGEERAIVTDIAGTTRDVLEEQIQIAGIGFRLMDTAGIRKTNDVVEQIGVTRSKERMEDADLVVYVADSSTELDHNDIEILSSISNKKAIIILNKTDLEAKTSVEQIKYYTSHSIILASMKDQTGIDIFEETVKEMFFHGKISFNDEIYITNIRQKNSLETAQKSIEQVLSSIEKKMPEDFFTIDMMNAYEELGYIIGESVDDDLVNEIFSKFCMGK